MKTATGLGKRSPPAPPLRSTEAGPAPRGSARGPFLAHAAGLGPLLGLSLWLTRHFFLDPAGLPAGTDMLGFVARARANADWRTALSAWNPTGLGGPRQLNLESVLGVMAGALGDPVLTVKLVSLLLYAASGFAAYFATYRWYRNRLVAFLSGLLYLTFQTTLTRWTAGHLNVQVVIAALPLIAYLWTASLEQFRIKYALGFAAVVSAVMLARLDLIVYTLPYLALFVLVRLVVVPRRKELIRNLAATLAAAVPAMFALNLYWLVPLLSGIRAPWVNSQRLFDDHAFLERSIDVYPSLLGLAREIGYLAWNYNQTWLSHPAVPRWVYWGSLAVLVGIAFGALARHRGSRTIFLAAAALMAAFLGKGFRDPLGGPYRWAVEHLPIFGNVRAPGRWLFFQALSYSVLAALTLRLLVAGRQRGSSTMARLGQACRAAALVVLPTLIVMPNAPLIRSGLQTWRIDAEQAALLDRLERERDGLLVATVPYDQTVRLIEQDRYRGVEHDLGMESSAFTGHPVVNDVGWSPRNSQLVDFTTSLLESRDDAFEKLLGTVGVGYLLKLNYPASSPHLTQQSHPFHQHAAVEGMAGLEPISRNDGGGVYRLSSASPRISFRPHLAVVLGGRSGLASLAVLPGVDISRWAAITADDALTAGGLPLLADLIRRARLVVLANERPEDLAVFAARPVARAPGISDRPQLEQLSQNVVDDEATRRGSLTDASVGPARGPSPTPRNRDPRHRAEQFSAASSFSLRSRRSLEAWARVMVTPRAGRITFRVDGRIIGSSLPLAAREGGFVWVPLGEHALGSGRHTLTISAERSDFGLRAEVDEVRFVDRRERERAAEHLERALQSAGGKLAFALDAADAAKWADSSSTFQPVGDLPRGGEIFWEPLRPEQVITDAEQAPDGGPALAVSARGARPEHSILRHRYEPPEDWSGSTHLFLSFRGSGSGQVYRLVVEGGGQAHYLLRDDRPGWRLAALPVGYADAGGAVNWSKVREVRLASDNPRTPATFGVGPILAGAPGEVAISYPVRPAGVPREAILREPGRDAVRTFHDPVSLPEGSDALRINLPSRDLVEGRRILVAPPAMDVPAETSGGMVAFRRTGPTGYRFEVEAPEGGILLLNQAYDPHWRTDLGSGDARPLPMFSTVSGFRIGPGTHRGSIRLSGERAVALGAQLSGVAALAIVGLIVVTRRKGRW